MKTIEAIEQRLVFGETLKRMGEKYPELVVLDSDVAGATKTSLFAEQYPERFIQAGIAEANMVSMAAGLSTTGKIPVVSTFSYFLSTRVLDQIRSICYANLNVKFVGTHGGVSPGLDGASHHAITDLAHMRCIPGMVLLCPGDIRETEEAIDFMLQYNGPVYLRLSRNECSSLLPQEQYQPGVGRSVQEGKDITLITTGVMLERTMQAAKKLESRGYDIGIVHIGSLKPFDKELVQKVGRNTKAIVTIEEHSVIGGLGSAVTEALEKSSCGPIQRLGIQDTFTRSGNYGELLDMYGLAVDNIVNESISTIREAE